MNDIRIVAKTKNYVVIHKPNNLATCSIKIDEEDNALKKVLDLYPECKQVVSVFKSIEYGLIHRIDTVTEGLILIACNQTSYDFLIQEQKNNKIVKTYTALCSKTNLIGSIQDGYPESPIISNSIREGDIFVVSSSFRHYGKGHKEVRPVLNYDQYSASKKTYAQKKSSNKVYQTKIIIDKIINDKVLVICEITNGFRHQVRSHLTWCGLPIIGDSIYSQIQNERILFYASSLSFVNPETKKKEIYSIEELCKKELSIFFT